MKTRACMIIAIGCLGLNLATVADVLEMKNGTILNGKFQGGTADTVRFDSGSGTQVVATSEIIALTFTTQKAAAAAPAAAAVSTSAAAPAPAPAAQSVNLPAGTTLVVRTVDAVSSKNQAGTPFTTRLEYDLEGTSLKAGTTITGKVQSSTQAGRVRGQSTLDLRLTQITVNGKQVPIVTSGYQQAGEKSIKKAAKGAAAGAAIGAIADDAGKGAAIG